MLWILDKITSNFVHTFDIFINRALKIKRQQRASKDGCANSGVFGQEEAPWSKRQLPEGATKPSELRTNDKRGDFNQR